MHCSSFYLVWFKACASIGVVVGCKMSKGVPRLSRLGVLAPAALSACIDASVLAAPAAGAIVSTVLKELSKAFMLKK